MGWYGENGLEIYCDNGLVAEQDECPCGECYQPDSLIITISEASPNEGANGIYVIGRYNGEPLYNDTGHSPYTFPYNDYTYVLLTDSVMLWLQCQPDDNYIKSTTWDDGYDVGPKSYTNLYTEYFRYSFDYNWGFWGGKINVEPVFL